MHRMLTLCILTSNVFVFALCNHCQNSNSILLPNWLFATQASNIQVMPDDHSELVPPLPIPNRTVKRFRADDSAATSVKVGYRQAFIPHTPAYLRKRGFCFWGKAFRFHSPALISLPLFRAIRQLITQSITHSISFSLPLFHLSELTG